MTHDTPFMDIKRQTLADQLQALLEEYQVANAQLVRTLSDADRVRLERQLRDLEQRIAKTEADLAALDHSPVIADMPSSADPPTPPVLVPDHPQKPSRKAPIWAWYFVVVLLCFVLGVVTDLADLFGLSRCTALWLATALALISGVAILGFSWLPDQRSLHMKKDRVILGGLTLMVTIGLAASALASCCTTPPPVVVALKTSHDTYVTAWNDEGDRDWKLWGWTNHPDADDWERFELRCVDGDKATLLTYHRRYVTAMDKSADWVLRGPRLETDGADDSELFTLLNPQTKNPLSCSRVVRQLEQDESVSLVLKTEHGRYVTAKNGKEDGEWRIWADEPGPIRDEQIFTVIKQLAIQN